jgi:signal transduction histidine kinase/ActR/RegA family two-component response regulator
MPDVPAEALAAVAQRQRSPVVRLGLRARVLLLLLIAVLPAIFIQGYNEYDLRQARERDIRQQVVQITKQFGEEMGELREGARQLLLTLGQLPAVRQQDAASCNAFFDNLQTQYANYAVLGAADTHGNVFCSSTSSGKFPSVARDEFFKRALSSDGLAVGNYWVDPVTGQKEIHFATRFTDKEGHAGGVVFAGLDLNWLVEHLKGRGLSPTASILIADRLGNIIARLPNPEALVGKNMRKTHEAIMDGNTAGWEEARGVDGIERIFGYVPAQLPPYDFFLSAGQSKAEAVAPIDRATKLGTALIVLGVALAAYLAWWGGRIFIERPIDSLLEATRKWRTGDYSHRVRLTDTGSEIAALGTAFNEMVDALAARDRAQRQAEEQLRTLNTTLEERVAQRTNELANANRLLREEINERERAQSELLHAHKIDAIGQLTSGIAHDFNNLLTAVLGNLTVARRRAQDERSIRALDTAMRAGRRGAKLVGDLLAFSRRQRLELQPIDVNDVLAGTQELLDRALGSLVHVEIRSDPDLWKAVGDPGQLELAMLNLAINARDAMPTGGTVRVTTANVAAGDPLLPDDLAGDFVMIAVSDTGTGMSEQVRAKVFEPFFTTKAIGKGSGLGLSMVYGLVNQCRGGVKIDSQPGHGTTVSMFFPRATEDMVARVEGSAIDPAPLTPVRPGAKLLVVDDDADVREFAASALRDAGYVVREAKDGAASLALLREEDDLALLITDYAMPLMTGADLYRRAVAIRPNLPGILITGFANLPVDDETIAGMHIIRKPFDIPDLLRAINQRFDRAPAVGVAA